MKQKTLTLAPLGTHRFGGERDAQLIAATERADLHEGNVKRLEGENRELREKVERLQIEASEAREARDAAELEYRRVRDRIHNLRVALKNGLLFEQECQRFQRVIGKPSEAKRRGSLEKLRVAFVRRSEKALAKND